jgi:hypothetical protein
LFLRVPRLESRSGCVGVAFAQVLPRRSSLMQTRAVELELLNDNGAIFGPCLAFQTSE